MIESSSGLSLSVSVYHGPALAFSPLSVVCFDHREAENTFIKGLYSWLTPFDSSFDGFSAHEMSLVVGWT